MLTLWTPNHRWGYIIVVGYVVKFEDEVFDMRVPNHLYNYSENFAKHYKDMNHNKMATQEDILRWHLGMFLDEELEHGGNWGATEQDFSWLSTSEDATIRQMVALNGYRPQLLSRDEDSLVRASTTQSLINDRKCLADQTSSYAVAHHRDDNFLDEMLLNEEDDEVLSLIAEYGKPSHLDNLLMRDSLSIQTLHAIASHGIESYIAKIANHKNTSYRVVAAQYGNLDTLDQLERDNSDDSDILKKTALRRAELNKFKALDDIKALGYQSGNPLWDSVLSNLNYAEKFDMINKGQALKFFDKQNSILLDSKISDFMGLIVET